MPFSSHFSPLPLCLMFFKTFVLMSSSALTLLFFFFSFFYSTKNFFPHSPLQVSHHIFCSPIILSLRAISLPYIAEYLSLLFFLYALLFSLPLCRSSTLFFFFFFKPTEVLIRRDSQFNYFYSGARPRESCSFSSVFLHILSLFSISSNFLTLAFLVYLI